MGTVYILNMDGFPPLSQMMRTEVTKFNKRYGIVKVDAKGYVGADLVVEAELTLAMAKQS